MGLLCCFRPSAGLTAQRGSEEAPNVSEVAVPEPARSIAAGNLTAIPQATQATSTKPHFEVRYCHILMRQRFVSQRPSFLAMRSSSAFMRNLLAAIGAALQVAALLVELLHALACPDYDNIQAPVDITQRVASVVRSHIGAAAVRYDCHPGCSPTRTCVL